MTENPGPFPGSDPAPAAPSPGTQSSDAGQAVDAPAGTGAKRTRTIGVLSALVVLTLVVGVLLYVFDGGRNADAAVSVAAANSAAGHTAQVAVVGSVGLGGASTSFTANGNVDFDNGASELTVGASVAGHQVTQKVDFVNGTAYVDEPQLATLVPGKQWISVDLSGLTGAGAGSGIDPTANPAAWLPVLAGAGGTVTPLGPSTIDGSAVQGYSVQTTPSAMERYLSTANVPSWMKSMFSKVTIGDLNFKVYVDDAGLLRRITVDAQLTAASSETVQLQESITFSNYGTPVTVTAPTPSQVLTLQQALGSLGNALGSGSTF